MSILLSNNHEVVYLDKLYTPDPLLHRTHLALSRMIHTMDLVHERVRELCVPGSTASGQHVAAVVHGESAVNSDG